METNLPVENTCYDKDIEEAILGSLLVVFAEDSKSSKEITLRNAFARIVFEDFYFSINAALFKIMKRAFENKRRMDNLLLHQEANAKLKDRCPPAEFFFDIVNKVATAANLPDYILTLKTLSLNLRQTNVSLAYSQDLKNGKPLNEALEKFQQEIKKINAERERLKDPSSEEYEQEYANSFNSLLSYYKKEREAIKTGFDNFDEFLDGGLFTGLYIFGAVTGVGKTTFALQIADYIASNKKDVLFFSGEMTMPEIVAKSLSRNSINIEDKDIDEEDIRGLTAREIMTLAKSIMPDKEKNKLLKLAFKKYEEQVFKNLRIIDGRQSMDAIKEEIDKYQRIKKKPPVVFIDYLQALQYDAKSDMRLQIDDAILALRTLSVANDTPFVVISSLNRKSYDMSAIEKEKKAADEKQVVLSSFKESGAIEYGADVLLTLQGKEQSDVDKEKNKRGIELRILKNRMGNAFRSPKEALLFDFYYKFNLFVDKGKTDTNDRAHPNVYTPGQEGRFITKEEHFARLKDEKE
jgi:replicative DNA helicase